MIVLRGNGESIDEAAIQQESSAVLSLISERMEGEDPQTLKARAREWAEENLIEAALIDAPSGEQRSGTGHRLLT